MCQIPDESMKVLHGFPMMPFQDQFAYYSNMGPITAKHSDQLKKVEKVLIMIHGSSRNAEDYFCASLSLVPKEERDKVLVITPRFLAPDDIDGIIAEYVENNNIWFYQEDDETVSDGSAPPHLEFLIWQDKSSDGFPLSHTWRYGADAMSAPISSFDALDRLVAFLDRTKSIFPNLKQVSVAGHSAGGQFSHRWALLSNEAFWSSREVEIRAIAANPRSYCYLDERRWIQVDENTMMFEKPSDESIGSCPEYNEWTWGLEEGEYLDCRYKDLAVNQTSSSAMAERYALRNVSYLTGEYDTITQDDHCATHSFQGRDRHERALNYFAALKTFFSSTYLNHQIYTVPESPHDHFLM
jgi:pimeloyl-ACP methyl ester carboxylesterase